MNNPIKNSAVPYEDFNRTVQSPNEVALERSERCQRNIFRGRDSLKAKVSFASVASVIFFALVLGGYFVYKENETRVSAVKSEIKKSASFLVPQAYFLLKRNDPASLLDYTQIVESIVAKGNFSFAEIVDYRGNLKVPLDVMGSKSHARTISKGPWESLALGQDYIIQDEDYEDAGPVIEGIFGVLEQDRILGYVILGVSKRPIQTAFWKNVTATCTVLFLLLGISLFCSLKLVGRATQPVLNLANAVERLKDTDSLEVFNMAGPREVKILAGSVKKALSRMRSYDQEMKSAIEFKTKSLRKSQEEMRTILDSFRRLSKYLTLKDAVSVIIDLARGIVYCNEAYVVLRVDEEGSPIPGGKTFNCSFSSEEMCVLSCGLVDRVIEKGDLEVLQDVQGGTCGNQVLLRSVKSCALYPLFSGKDRRGLGVLFLGMTGETEFSEPELSTLKGIMEPIGLAFENVFLYSKVEKLAAHDPMTGLLRRQNCEEELAKAIDTAKREDWPLYVLLADIDKFKTINDTHGHPAGDQVIKSFAKIIRNQTRRGLEHAGRWGGEEFMVILQNADLEKTSQAYERILSEVRSAQVSIEDGKKIAYTVSMGIAGFPADGTSKEELIKRSDQSLYAAKARGRNQAVVWNKKILSDPEGKDQLNVV